MCFENEFGNEPQNYQFSYVLVGLFRVLMKREYTRKKALPSKIYLTVSDMILSTETIEIIM